MTDRTELEMTALAGAADVLCLHLDPPRPARLALHDEPEEDPYATEPDVDVELRLAGAAAVFHG